MHVDIGGGLATVADPGISRAGLDRLDERVATAHERISQGMADQDHGYAALNLPETADPEQIRAAIDQLPEPAAILVAGIGGSALGAATLAEALPTNVPLYTLDNVDPAATAALLDEVPLAETVLVGVSRSGTTAETLANFLVARDAIDDAGGDWTEQTLVITGSEGPLAEMATAHDLPRLAVPDGVPGRYAVLSTVGLAPAALAGIDIDAVLEGGAQARDTLTGSLYDCPGYAYGALAYALDSRGAAVNVMMPYAESLESFAEWFAQLWAESLGKDGLGQLPGRALGVTDQHSQLQRYRAGPRNVLVTVLGISDRPTYPIPEPDHEALAYLADTGLEDLMAAERRATKGSLSAAGCPTIGIELETLDPERIGELLYTMEAACILAGELYGVETFTQPAVEWGKRATRALLRGETTAETETIAKQEQLIVGTQNDDL